MNSKQVERAAILVATQKRWPKLIKACSRTDGRGGMELTVDVTMTKKLGCTEIFSAGLDRQTGLLILKVAKQIVASELKKLGVGHAH